MWSIGFIGVLLILAWVLGLIFFEGAGLLVHLLLVVGGLMLVFGLMARLRDNRPRVR